MLMKIDGLQAKNQEWWNNAWQSIDTAFTEIKAALVEYNAVKDQPVASNARLNIKTVFAHAPDASLPVDVNTINWLKKSNAVVSRRFPFPIKGVIYDKGIPWFRNRYTLELSTIEADLKDMESIGINTIERTMPGVYDRGIGKVLMSDNMHLIPRFWFPAAPQAVADDNKMKEQEEKILRVIRENVHKNYVTAWDLGDDILYHLSLETYKPDYFFYEQKYIAWLSNLCRAIRKIDNTRPILMDLHWDAKGRSRFSYYKAHVPEIDIYMLVADKKYRKGLNEPLEKDMAWGQVPVALWSSLPSIAQSGIVPAWQDNETTNYVKLNGIIDLDGRKKDLFHVVSATWGHATHDSTEMPRVKILRSAEIAIPGEKIIYHLMHHEADSAWHIYTGDEKNTRFEWYLVKLDQYGNTMFIKRAGNQPYIELTIPDKPLYYELYVEVISGKYVTTSHSTLNTPLE